MAGVREVHRSCDYKRVFISESILVSTLSLSLSSLPLISFPLSSPTSLSSLVLFLPSHLNLSFACIRSLLQITTKYNPPISRSKIVLIHSKNCHRGLKSPSPYNPNLKDKPLRSSQVCVLVKSQNVRPCRQRYAEPHSSYKEPR